MTHATSRNTPMPDAADHEVPVPERVAPTWFPHPANGDPEELAVCCGFSDR
jgi:hypothetical protein